MSFSRFIFLMIIWISGGSWPALAADLSPEKGFALDDVLETTLERNFSIRQARERVREKGGLVTTVAAAGMPSVSASGILQKNSIQTINRPANGPVFIQPSGRYWRLSVTARQTLYAGGGIAAATSAADLNREAAIAEMRETISQALLDARLKFYNALLSKEQIAVQEKSVELLTRQLREITLRYEIGTVSRFERLRAEVALANAQPALIKARNAYRLALDELRQVMGLESAGARTGEIIFELKGALHVEAFAIDLEKALSDARENRAELVRLARLSEAANEGRTEARSGYKPEIAATVGGLLRKGPTNDFGDSRRGWTTAAEANWAVASQEARGRVIQAESRYSQSQITLQEAGLAIEVEVRRATSSLEEANDLVTASVKSVEQAQDALRIAENRFAAGSSTQLEMLQAQTALTSARTNQLRAVYGHTAAVAQLRRAIGLTEVEFVSGNEIPSASQKQNP